MTLDPQSESILAARRLAKIPPVRLQALADVRSSRNAWRTSGPQAPLFPVDAVSERSIPVTGGEILVRLYRHGTPASPTPAIVYLHGGGWVLGDLDHSDTLCRFLARETEYLVANVDYRLAPEHPYPVAAEDCLAAFQWLAGTGTTLGVDGARVAVAGGSAGGNLAAAVTLMARDRGLRRPAAQVLAYPVLDDACEGGSYSEFADGYIVTTDDMKWYWEQYLQRPTDRSAPYACPLKATDLAGLPPAFICTAEYDPVRDDGERYAVRLQAHGVPVDLHRYPGTLHGFFAMPGTLEKGTESARAAASFLRLQLGH